MYKHLHASISQVYLHTSQTPKFSSSSHFLFPVLMQWPFEQPHGCNEGDQINEDSDAAHVEAKGFSFSATKENW